MPFCMYISVDVYRVQWRGEVFVHIHTCTLRQNQSLSVLRVESVSRRCRHRSIQSTLHGYATQLSMPSHRLSVIRLLAHRHKWI
jgi:hypothetical protein